LEEHCLILWSSDMALDGHEILEADHDELGASYLNAFTPA
jgi:hypothetical protein